MIKHTSKKIKAFYFSFILMFFVAGAGLALYQTEPHRSELNFKEYSTIKNYKGSVIPASCVSGVHYTHPYDLNFDVTIDNGCPPVCAPGESFSTTYVYRCFYTDVGGFWDNPVTYYAFTEWQGSNPGSCPAGNMQTTVGGSFYFTTSGTIQTKEMYSSCSAPASIDINVF